MKPSVFTTLCFAVLTSTAYAHTKTTENGFNIYEGAFNVTEQFYSSGIFHENRGGGSIAIWEFGTNGDIYSLLDGLARYAEEQEEGALADELSQAERIACARNRNLSDNKAYLAVAYSEIGYQTPNMPYRRYRHGDIVSGSDWNNNGKIDVFEGVRGYHMVNSGGYCYISI